MTGLVGTGVIYGAWKPIVRSLLSPERAATAITETEKFMTKGGAAYLILDASPTVIEATFNTFDDAISVQAREEWYNGMKAYHNSRGIFGDAPNVAWYDRIGNSVFNVMDTFVPAAWHKFADPATDGRTSDWIAACRWKLKNGYACR